MINPPPAARPSFTPPFASPYLRACLLLIVAMLLVTAWVYPQLPMHIPRHWDANGHINGTGPRVIVWLTGPGAMCLILLLAPVLPAISPKRYELVTFLPTVYYFIFLLTACIAYIDALTLYVALGGAVAMDRAVGFGLFLLLTLIGNPLGKVRRNFYIGVRTPWTLASEQVWYATHRLAARLMVACGLLGLLSVALDAPHPLRMALAWGWAVIPVVFSLLYYKRLEKSGRLETH